MAFWSHHEQSILSFLQIPATVWSAWLFYCSQSRRLHGRFPNVSWVGSRILFENGHPHWLLEASFAAWLLWLASFALCSSRHRQPGAASMTSVILMLLKKVLCNMVNMVQSWWSSQENVARIVIGIVGSERASWWDHEPFWTLDAYWDATTNWSLSGMMTQTSNHTHGSIAVPTSCHGIHRMLQVA